MDTESENIRSGFRGRGMTKAEIEKKIEVLKKELYEQTAEMNTKKLVLNSSFGKFGNKYSNLYAPQLLIQVTLTGQLALLMLIEHIECNGGIVVSANTDGVVVHAESKQAIDDVRGEVADFELLSGFDMEETPYRAIYIESVNNYVAVKPDGSVKAKGVYAKTGIAKNPCAPICSEAVRKYLANDIEPEETIGACNDILEFCTVRRVTGGATWNGEAIGKVVRWYIGNGIMNSPILYAKNGNKVPKSDFAIPLMALPDKFPDNVNLHHYLIETERMIARLGVK